MLNCEDLKYRCIFFKIYWNYTSNIYKKYSKNFSKLYTINKIYKFETSNFEISAFEKKQKQKEEFVTESNFLKSHSRNCKIEESATAYPQK